MKITFLGTGTSTGVPEIGCSCEVCTSRDRRDSRLRTSVLVETQGKNILLDCGPDFRQQALANKVSRVDAVIISHEHYDHVGGLDDLRPFCMEKGLDIYAEDYVVSAIRTRMPYAFRAHHFPGLPRLELHPVGKLPFMAAGVPIVPVRLLHGCLEILGYRIGNMAYLTDVKHIPGEEFEKLENLDVLIIDALRKKEHPSHQNLAEALANIARIRPKEAYLIHLSHRMGLHAVVENELASNIHPAYDGLVIQFGMQPV
ncbi:MAG: MBL fold metallo-hydrolase [Tannerellaceae bacterium]|jgi:phosphoribosyl 1,2-cyclic phosphate phosphodiesterase|nr:MBL fold metallo-hydrolase [Tannerellaceae bacterium]